MEEPNYNARLILMKTFVDDGTVYIPKGDALIHAQGAAKDWVLQKDTEHGDAIGENIPIQPIDANTVTVPQDKFEQLLGCVNNVDFSNYLEERGNRNRDRDRGDEIQLFR